MKKIPTVFLRDPEDMSRVTDEVNPACQWVLDGEGVATRKWDGTCVMFDGESWWARREVKPGKAEPEDYVALETDPNTGKTVGWEPIEQSSFFKFWSEAYRQVDEGFDAGTYELVGPRINGNPERRDRHVLIRHGVDEILIIRTVESLRNGVASLANLGIEGIVWHHPDGRMAKLKARDLR